MARFAMVQLFFAVGTALVALCPAAYAQLEQLANRVPDSANTLMVINVKAAYASPLAKAQNWQPAGLEAQRSGMIALPARAEAILMAAEMDFEFMQPHWEIAVAYVSQSPAMQEIAKRSGGQLDRIAGAEAVERPNDSMVVQLGPRVVGAMAPANRQQVSRWVRESRVRKSPELSSYLTEALAKAKVPTNQIVLSLDLRGVFAPAEVAEKLSKEDSVLKDKSIAKELSEIIASLRGATLAIQLENPAQAELSLDFDQASESLADFAKPLLLHVLAEHGAEIDDIQNWQVRPQGKSIVLEGKLSKSGLRRVLSLLSSPVGPLAASSSNSQSSEDAVAEASQRYFQAVTNYLNDLFFSGRQPRSLEEMKIWVQRYARKIDDLERYRVDKDVLAFGQQATDSLREIVRVLDRAEMRGDIRDSKLYDAGRRRYGRYGAYGYYEKQYAARDRQVFDSVQAENVLQTTQAIVDQLRELSAQTRQTMTERYHREF